MDIFLSLILLFYIGGTLGWIIELFYRRIFSAKKWMNPGFLVGPFLPIYGFGLWALYGLGLVDFPSLPTAPRIILRVLLIGIALTAIEFLAGKIFILGMHVKLWDYSKRWGNIDGIICPEFSLIWTVLGSLYCFFVHPVIQKVVDWFYGNIVSAFLLGIFVGIFVIDLFYSFRILAKIRKFAQENHITVRLQTLQKNIAEHYGHRKFRHFLFTMRGNLIFPEFLRESVAQIKKKLPRHKKGGDESRSDEKKED